MQHVTVLFFVSSDPLPLYESVTVEDGSAARPVLGAGGSHTVRGRQQRQRQDDGWPPGGQGDQRLAGPSHAHSGPPHAHSRPPTDHARPPLAQSAAAQPARKPVDQILHGGSPRPLRSIMKKHPNDSSSSSSKSTNTNHVRRVRIQRLVTTV